MSYCYIRVLFTKFAKMLKLCKILKRRKMYKKKGGGLMRLTDIAFVLHPWHFAKKQCCSSTEKRDWDASVHCVHVPLH